MDRRDFDVAGLFRQHNEGLVGQLQRALTVSEDEARDLAQFAWLKLIEKPPVDHENVRGWLFTVAKYEAFGRWRKGRREVAVDELHGANAFRADDVDQGDTVDERRQWVSEHLDAAWADLSEGQRLALGLWAQGLPYRQIAAQLGRSYTWVNRHITEGHRALRRAFAEQVDRDSP